MPQVASACPGADQPVAAWKPIGRLSVARRVGPPLSAWNASPSSPAGHFAKVLRERVHNEAGQRHGTASVENGTTILFGLPGVGVDRVVADGHGARSVHLSTTDPDAAACPECGVFSTVVRQRRTTCPKDLPYGEAPVVVRWHKRQFACRQRLCPRKAFTESIAELPPYARITGRTRRAAAVAVGSGRSVSAVTKELPMSWPVAHAAFVAHAQAHLVEPAAPRVLGIDETRRGRPRWSKDDDGKWHRSERFETNFVDLSGPGGLLGQTAGRSAKTVTDWLDARGEDGRTRCRWWRSTRARPTGRRSNGHCRTRRSSPTTPTWSGSPTRWSPTSGSGSPVSSPRRPAWPGPSTPGGPRSRPSAKPGSPTPVPKAPTG